MNASTIIYCDGSCIGNPGPGGWAAIILGHPDRTISGSEVGTTNNRMELTAAIEALKTLPDNSKVEIRTDSKYVIQGITSWRFGWEKRGWISTAGTPILNKDLWERLIEVSSKHIIKWEWVKGHSGNTYNSRVDKIAHKRAQNG